MPRPFCVMELARGGSLEDRRARFGDVEVGLGPVTRGDPAGLAELHANGASTATSSRAMCCSSKATTRRRPSRRSPIPASLASVRSTMASSRWHPSLHARPAREPTRSHGDGGRHGHAPVHAARGLVEPCTTPERRHVLHGRARLRDADGAAALRRAAGPGAPCGRIGPDPRTPRGGRRGGRTLILACLHVEPSERPRAPELADQIRLVAAG